MMFIRENITAMRKKERAELILKQRSLLLEEFRLGVYTVKTYWEVVAKLEHDTASLRGTSGQPCYGANHLETMTFVQMQNHLEVKIYTLLLYMRISIAVRSKEFDVIWPCRAAQNN